MYDTYVPEMAVLQLDYSLQYDQSQHYSFMYKIMLRYTALQKTKSNNKETKLN